MKKEILSTKKLSIGDMINKIIRPERLIENRLRELEHLPPVPKRGCKNFKKETDAFLDSLPNRIKEINNWMDTIKGRKTI